MKFSIDYKLTGAGWSECTISVGVTTSVITASYLSDALESLAGAVLAVTRGIKFARASFDEEPGEYRWVFEHIDGENVEIRILEFPELWSNKDDKEGKVIFDAQVPLLVLVRAMVRCLSDVLETHGIEGYKQKWVEHEFPLKAYDELRQALASLKQYPT